MFRDQLARPDLRVPQALKGRPALRDRQEPLVQPVFKVRRARQATPVLLDRQVRRALLVRRAPQALKGRPALRDLQEPPVLRERRALLVQQVLRA